MAGFPHQLQSAALGARPGERAGLRAIHVGGDRVRPRLLDALAVVAPTADCTVVYGSTEIEPISAIDARSYLQLYAAGDPAGGICVGRLVDGLELRIEPLPDEASLGSSVAPQTPSVACIRDPSNRSSRACRGSSARLSFAPSVGSTSPECWPCSRGSGAVRSSELNGSRSSRGRPGTWAGRSMRPCCSSGSHCRAVRAPRSTITAFGPLGLRESDELPSSRVRPGGDQPGAGPCGGGPCQRHCPFCTAVLRRARIRRAMARKRAS
jgi:hypothetical protein